ncbi:MAG: PorV/PorQ family protein [candidate division WOR-3 bacterium]|nr:PorV/PorQ family protein [candidate division WOR-3 bacterium]
MLVIIISLLMNGSLQSGEAGFNFLKLTPSAKEAAMANTSISVENDKSLSGFDFIYNPAQRLTNTSLGVSYLSLPAGIHYGVISYKRNRLLPFTHSSGVSLIFLNSGPIKHTNEQGNPLGTFSVSYANLLMGGTVINNNELKVGVNFKLLYGAIEKFYGLGLASDIGVRFLPPVKNLSIGLVIRNLGYQIKPFDTNSDKLPLELGIGSSYKIEDNLSFAWDIRKAIDSPIFFSVGIEGWINKYLALRGGYNSLRRALATGGGSDILAGFAVGLGVKVSKYQVDYSFTPMLNLGRQHHLSLTLSR